MKPKPSVQTCRVCGCTEHDCRGCIKRTGMACFWLEDDLCSACRGADTPLKVEIVEGELVIRLGIERLDGHECHPTIGPLTFTDRHAWAREIIYEIGRDEEDGTTPFDELLDKVLTAAIENGAQGIDHKKPTFHADE